MPLPQGTEVYQCDTPPVVARGVSLTAAELDDAIKNRLPPLLNDDEGNKQVDALLGSLANTQFEESRLAQILKSPHVLEDWRVGEAIAETFLTDFRKCEFPWPSGRDLKNPNASPAGSDLVGFDRREATARFAFGEVKTSAEERWPPQVMTGRHGMQKQLEDLKDGPKVKDKLVKYLAFRATNAPWLPQFREAATRYLKNHRDVSLFGVLVRDVDIKREDLSGRSTSLANDLPGQTKLELRSYYLPKGKIDGLAKRAAKAQGVKK
jgi:hypothetical protein